MDRPLCGLISHSRGKKGVLLCNFLPPGTQAWDLLLRKAQLNHWRLNAVTPQPILLKRSYMQRISPRPVSYETSLFGAMPSMQT